MQVKWTDLWRKECQGSLHHIESDCTQCCVKVRNAVRNSAQQCETVRNIAKHSATHCATHHATLQFTMSFVFWGETKAAHSKKYQDFSCPQARNVVNYNVAWCVAQRVALELTQRRQGHSCESAIGPRLLNTCSSQE